MLRCCPCRAPHRDKKHSGESAASNDSVVSGPRPVCPSGIGCKIRISSHLNKQAHPFDPDYILSCEAAGLEPEQQNLRNLFTWIDLDSSGKISTSELVTAVPLISMLFGEEVVITTEAWERLDEDRNGQVNFSELAGWAGPRLGLPLGVKHLFSSGRATDEAPGCAVIGCPCESFKVSSKASRETALTATSADTPTRTQAKLQLCVCGHKKGAHESTLPAELEVPYPMYWDKKDSSGGEFFNMVQVGSTHLALFQQLLDGTYENVWTRDRKKHNPTAPDVPESYRVVRAFRSENSKVWRMYGVRRAELLADHDEHGGEPDYALYSDVKSTHVWRERGGVLADRIKPQCNEWYLFHGTSETNAHTILSDDFKFNFAGRNTGSLYGRGIYLSESIVKADEYSKPNSVDEFTVLLCRVLGGRVNYTDELEPNAEQLTQSCIEGPYDCVIGDRVMTKGTFREFVLFDTENVYAEYMIQYTREGCHARRDTERSMSSRRDASRVEKDSSVKTRLLDDSEATDVYADVDRGISVRTDEEMRDSRLAGSEATPMVDEAGTAAAEVEDVKVTVEAAEDIRVSVGPPASKPRPKSSRKKKTPPIEAKAKRTPSIGKSVVTSTVDLGRKD